MSSVYCNCHCLTLVIQRVNWCIHYHPCSSPLISLGKCLVVFAPIMNNKVIADLFPEEVAINDWLINLLLSLFRGTVPFRVEAQMFLNATCGLEWRDFCVEIGLEEKWDAGICQDLV